MALIKLFSTVIETIESIYLDFLSVDTQSLFTLLSFLTKLVESLLNLIDRWDKLA